MTRPLTADDIQWGQRDDASPYVFQRLAGGGYGLSLVDRGVMLEFRDVRIERKQFYAELNVICEWGGTRPFPNSKSISCADLNLSSLQAREARGKSCAARAHSKPQEFDWSALIDDGCRFVIDAERKGSDGIVLDDAPDAGPPRDFDVHGLLIPADSHSQLICDGGGLKSLLLLLVLGEMARRGIPTGFCDWEWTAARHKARKVRLFGAERLEHLHYVRCHNPITVERDRLRRFCDEHRIQFIAIDSIGAACDGKLADDDVARAFNRALDGLPPSLSAAHVPKTQTDATVDLKAFGSAFFHNYARVSWSVKKSTGGAESDLATVMLVPHKQNDGARLRPVALEFVFTAERITVRGVDASTVEGLADKLPLASRMVAALKRGPMTYAALATELNAKPNSVVQAANRKSTFTKIDGPDGVTRIALVERRVP